MASAPIVSIIVPVYNRADLIEETLQSLLAQTRRSHAEILVVDDGSTDATPDILRRHEKDIRILHQENQGASAARNLALRHATGEFIAFCDSDDLWPPDKLERQIALLQSHPGAGFLYGHFLCFETAPDGTRREWTLDNPTPAGFIFPHLLERNFIVPSTVLVTRAALEAVGPFDTDCCNAEDYDFFLRLAVRFEAVYDEKLCCYYRQHRVSASRQKARYWHGFLRSLEKAQDLVDTLHRDNALRNPVDHTPIPEETAQLWKAMLRRRIASFHLRLARYWHREGSATEAWREAAEAFRLTPANPATWNLLWKALRQRLRPRKES